MTKRTELAKLLFVILVLIGIIGIFGALMLPLYINTGLE